ncbi:MAG: TauD/TfdA dioxygenase family protein [Hyphomicrobiaceae bacterium]
MRNYDRIEVKPLAGALGAEVDGVDIANLDDDTFRELYQAWLDHLVLFLRNQTITPEQQVAFAKRFGDIHLHPFMKSMDEHPEILEIIKEENDTYTFGSVWHSDQMFNPKPAKATILYARETPDAGGDTMFANMYIAYEELSDAMKQTLADVKTWNVGARNQHRDRRAREGRYVGNQKMSAKIQTPSSDTITDAAHPLFRKHPETGKTALYIGSHSKTLFGFKEEEAEPILRFLLDHSVQPEMTCRFRWEPGSMAIWDNRCTQHRALGDYAGKRRRMHRITVAGDEPIQAAFTH